MYIIGHLTCSGRNQTRKSGENRYSLSIPLWFAPFFDQVPNKGFALLNTCQSWTKMEESRLWGSYLGCVHCKSRNILQPSLLNSKSFRSIVQTQKYLLHDEKYVWYLKPRTKGLKCLWSWIMYIFFNIYYFDDIIV